MKFTKHLQPQVNPLSNIRKKEKAGEETIVYLNVSNSTNAGHFTCEV